MFRIVVLLLTCFFSLHSQEADNQKPPVSAIDENAPDINQLPVGWWEYFKVPPEELPDKTDRFYKNLVKLSSNFSPEVKNTSDILIQKILFNLKTFEQNKNQTVPQIPQPGPIANDYSIDDIINLHQSLNKQKVELKTVQEQILEKTQQLETTKDVLSRTRSSYAKTENRSESRLLTGLEIVSLRSQIEVIRQSLKLLEQTLKVRKQSLAHTQEEINTAVNRIVSSDLDLFLYAQKAKREDENWEQTESVVKRYQALESTASSESVGEKRDLAFLKLVQETDQAEIKETIAGNRYIFAMIELYLAQVINNPDQIDFYDVQHKVEGWQKRLTLFQPKMAEWKSQAERLLQRVGQILATNEKSPNKELNNLSPEQIELLRLAQENLVLIQQLENEIVDTQFLLDILNQKVSENIGGGRFWLQYFLDSVKAAYGKTIYWLTRELFIVGKNPITLLNILQFFVIIIITIWVSKTLLSTLTRFAHRRKGIKKSLVYRVSRLIYYLLLTIGLVVALSAIGFDFSNFLLIAGALGVGIGFGLQSIFNNFISGIIILFESHLKVGDYIELDTGLRGEIREINVRSTLITDNDGIDVLVPNSEIISNKVLNWTLKVPYRRFHIPFTVAYGTDKDLLAKLVVQAAKKVPHTLTKLGIPDPVVRLNKLGDYGMEFELVVWVTEKYTKRTRTTRSDYLWAIETTLREHNISIPYPQLDLRVLSDDS